MKSRLFIMIMICSAGLFTAVTAHAGDVLHGKKLYDAQCRSCHDTSIHTRKDSIIHTYTDLVNRVKFCDAQTKAGFGDKELKDVTAYLNATFYKFPKD